jgi:hypothetical protein
MVKRNIFFRPEFRALKTTPLLEIPDAGRLMAFRKQVYADNRLGFERFDSGIRQRISRLWWGYHLP